MLIPRQLTCLNEGIWIIKEVNKPLVKRTQHKFLKLLYAMTLFCRWTFLFKLFLQNKCSQADVFDDTLYARKIKNSLKTSGLIMIC